MLSFLYSTDRLDLRVCSVVICWLRFRGAIHQDVDLLLDLQIQLRQIGETKLAQIGVLKGFDRVGAVLLIGNNTPFRDLVGGFGAAAAKCPTRGDANASRRQIKLTQQMKCRAHLLLLSSSWWVRCG